MLLTIGKQNLSVVDYERVLFEDCKVVLDKTQQKEVSNNYNFLLEFATNKIIYGINTGLGPMAQYRIEDKSLNQLQLNLIRSHCTGCGKLFSAIEARATMLSRLQSIMKASSGIHPEVPDLLVSFLNLKIIPKIFQKGGVGASGDLVQLAHLGLNLIGEGEVEYNGKWTPTENVLSKCGLNPITIHVREGLGIVNGTSAMSGIGMVNLILATRLLNTSVALSAITNEIMCSFDDHFSHSLNAVKPHIGQQTIAKNMRYWLKDSQLIRNRGDHFYRANSQTVFENKVQEYYSLRCVPQILGPVFDTVSEVKQTVENEVNSVNDNPIIDHLAKHVYHGGNFHGDYVSLAMDKLKIAITKLTMLSDRQLNYLLNEKLNKQLPPFINRGVLGLNFGLQGAQFTATSTTAENQTLSFPMYLHSITVNNDNQDMVSMGCNAALITSQVIENAFLVVAIQSLAVAQAIDFLKCYPQLSSESKKMYDKIRICSGELLEDRPIFLEIEKTKVMLMSSSNSITFNP